MPREEKRGNHQGKGVCWGKLDQVLEGHLGKKTPGGDLGEKGILKSKKVTPREYRVRIEKEARGKVSGSASPGEVEFKILGQSRIGERGQETLFVSKGSSERQRVTGRR